LPRSERNAPQAAQERAAHGDRPTARRTARTRHRATAAAIRRTHGSTQAERLRVSACRFPVDGRGALPVEIEADGRRTVARRWTAAGQAGRLRLSACRLPGGCALPVDGRRGRGANYPRQATNAPRQARTGYYFIPVFAYRYIQRTAYGAVKLFTRNADTVQTSLQNALELSYYVRERTATGAARQRQERNRRNKRQ